MFSCHFFGYENALTPQRMSEHTSFSALSKIIILIKQLQFTQKYLLHYIKKLTERAACTLLEAEPPVCVGGALSAPIR